MKSPILAGLVGTAIALAGTTALAQDESTNRVAAKTDWSVFVEADPKECWGVSSPKETVNTKDGRVVAVKRGDILLLITFRPGSGSVGELSFTGGYPFAEGSTVNLDIGGNSFELFTKNLLNDKKENVGWAWAASSGDDAKIITAMKRGADAVLTARSSRGTQTKDTFSLLGLTAALEEAEKRCAE